MVSRQILNYLAANLLRREIDRPLFYFMLKASILIVSAISLFAFPKYSIYLLPVHLGIYFYFLGPFITMFHDANHNPLFKNLIFNRYFLDLFGLVYGSTPRTYFSHHVIMHHPENNEYGDISTTLPYQRDSIKDFLKYLIKFYFCLFSLSNYLKRSGNKSKIKFAHDMITAEVVYITVNLFLLFINPIATIGVSIIPVLITRTILIIGNWGEHALIDPNDYRNLYKSSTNIIGYYNKSCFNVGYHIGHHIKPTLHFSLLEKDFNDNIQTYSKADAMVFKDIHYPHIWFHLMTKNHRKLARKFVSLPGRKVRSEKEVIALIKSRLVPIPDN